MRKHETGIIYTNDNCIGCNTCISGCPITGANIARIENGKNRIIVDNDQCIHCGYCLNICEHNAREYMDDTSAFLLDLNNGHNISVAVSPAIFTNYPETAKKLLGYLKHLGVKHIFNVSVGSDICTWVCCNYLKQNPHFKGITSTCSAVVNYIEKFHPELIDFLIPVQSPLMCLAKYLRKYKNIDDDIAYISPCIAKEDEIISDNTDNLIQYNVTFSHLMKKFENIDYSQFSADCDEFSNGLGILYTISGGLKENLEYFLDYNGLIMNISNMKSLDEKVGMASEILNSGTKDFLFEIMQCNFGCTTGTGTCKNKTSLTNALNQYLISRKELEDNPDETALYSRSMPRKQRFTLLNQKYKELDFNDFLRTFTEHYKQPFMLSDEVYDQIFNQMHKTSESSRHIDCKSCGYTSCKKMAYSIANSYNVMDNCVRYEAEENYRHFTTEKVTGCPNIYVEQKDAKKFIQNGEIINYEYIQFKIKEYTLFSNILGYSGADSVLKEFAFQAEKILQTEEKLYALSTNNFVALVNRGRSNDFIQELKSFSLPSLRLEKDEKMQYSLICGVYQPDGTEFRSDTIEKKLLSAFTLAEQKNSSEPVYYNATISKNVIQNMMISQEVPAALDKDEFFVLFQPKVLIKDDILCGAEALIRWNKGDSIRSPGDFIPICESTGQVCKLDFFVLNSVCSKMHDWKKRGLPLVKISINFSKLHFNRSDIVDRICAVVDFWEIPHEYIEIEFTETLYHESQKILHDTIDMLKEKGFSSSIDDFGSGYSSLNLLQNMQFDAIKIDKSLIDSIQNNQKSKTVVTDIIKMAKDLNMIVVAEGVETKETANLLKELNCDLIQGYFYDKPLSTLDFENRLKSKYYYKSILN